MVTSTALWEGLLLSLFPNPTAAQFSDRAMTRFSHHAIQPGLMKMPLITAGGWNWMSFKVPLNPKHSGILYHTCLAYHPQNHVFSRHLDLLPKILLSICVNTPLWLCPFGVTLFPLWNVSPALFWYMPTQASMCVHSSGSCAADVYMFILSRVQFNTHFLLHFITFYSHKTWSFFKVDQINVFLTNLGPLLLECMLNFVA